TLNPSPKAAAVCSRKNHLIRWEGPVPGRLHQRLEAGEEARPQCHPEESDLPPRAGGGTGSSETVQGFPELRGVTSGHLERFLHLHLQRHLLPDLWHRGKCLERSSRHFIAFCIQ
ncbi:hypothetical protein chiPu_0025492, partial [Chiloscyllium punctatum]|nr:hypothetical protein [Chiloscyllium punctatum]